MEYLELRNKIINVLKEWSKPTSSFDAMWHGYSRLYEEVGCFDEKIIKKQMKQLIDEGLVIHLPTFTEEGIVCGSGLYWKKLVESELRV